MQTTIKNGTLSATINHKGAELTSIIRGEKNFLWDIDEKFWDKTSPVLFPIIGGLKNNSYEFQGKKYSLPRHGFAREMNFKTEETGEDFAKFSLRYNDDTLKVYPYRFMLEIGYFLQGNVLRIKYTVRNLGNSTMYYSIGGHPAFKIEGNLEDYSLLFDKNENLVSYKLQDNLFSGATKEIELANSLLKLNYGIFSEDALVLKGYSTTALTLQKNSEKILKVSFDEFPYLGIWTKDKAPFICIEPWIGLADSHDASGKIEEKEGIKTLAADSEKSAEWCIELF